MFNRIRKILFSNTAAMLVLTALSAAFYLRGIDWSLKSHPDEIAVARWLAYFPKTGHIVEKMYPEGFFQIHKLVDRVASFAEKKVAREWREWVRQDNNTCHELALKAEPVESEILYGRRLNVALVVLGVAFFFLAAKIMLESTVFAFAAAAIFALNPFIVEYAHYCETEGAMVATMMLSLFALNAAVKRKSLAAALLGAAVCGFAIASKYTMAPIMCVAPVVCGHVCRQRGMGWGKVLLFAGASVACMLLGFLLGSPSVFLNTSEYFKRMSWASSSDYIVAKGLPEGLRGQPWATERFKLASFLKEASKLGAATWWLTALALPLWFSRGARKFAVVTPLFVLSFVAYVVFKFPFFRAQEFVPMLPFMSISAILPLWWACKQKGGSKRARIAVAAAAAPLLCVSAHSNAASATRNMLSFARNDVRLEMCDWMRMCASENICVGYERFTGLAASDVPFHVVQLQKVEHGDLASPKNAPVGYIARGYFNSREMRNEITGKLFPRFEAAKNEFDSSAVPLRNFRILGGEERIRPTFAQVDVALWKRGGAAEINGAAATLPIVPPRPAAIYYAGQEYRVPENGDLLGPEEALQIVGKRRSVLLRPEKGVKYWAVVRHAAGDVEAKIKWNGMFEPAKKNIPPLKADYFEIKPNAWRAAKRDIMAAARVRMKGDDQSSICLLTITSDPAYAAHLLCAGGAPEKATELLGKTTGKTSVALNIEALAQRLAGNQDAQCAGDLLPALDALRENPDDKAFNIGGLNLATLNDFSNIRIGPTFMAPRAGTDMRQEFVAIETSVPVWLIPGKYTVKASLAGGAFLKEKSQCRNLRIRGSETLAAIPDFSMRPMESKRFEFEIIVDKPMRPELACEIASNGAQTALDVSSMEFSWSPRDMILENSNKTFAVK